MKSMTNIAIEGIRVRFGLADGVRFNIVNGLYPIEHCPFIFENDELMDSTGDVLSDEWDILNALTDCTDIVSVVNPTLSEYERQYLTIVVDTAYRKVEAITVQNACGCRYVQLHYGDTSGSTNVLSLDFHGLNLGVQYTVEELGL